MHYQPKVTLPGGQADAVEALVRWQHPTPGFLYPDRFVPLAEQTDLMKTLTHWVLSCALRDMSLQGSEFDHIAVSVNVSARHICHESFATQVAAALRDHAVPANHLMIEITETALFTDPGRAERVLAEVAGLGVGVSIDDFGIGPTSLSFLSSLPVHELKIDKGFVTDMMSDLGHAAIVRSIIDLGHNLSLPVVAEGVETEDIVVELGNAGCDMAQGFFFARPMPLSDLRPWLAEAVHSRPASVH